MSVVEIPTLETARLILRAPRFEDFDAFAAFIGSDRARFIGGPVTDQGAVWRAFAQIAGLWVLRGYGPFVWCLKDGTAIGSGGAWFPRGLSEPELGWMLWSPEHEGRGLATEAMQALLAWSFATLRLPSVVACIDADNAASIRMARRLGATEDPAAARPAAPGAARSEGGQVIYRFSERAAA